MKKRAMFLSLFVTILMVPIAYAQVPADEEDVVKITTTLIQIDAVVTDKNGNQVTDLNANDFELIVAGKKRKITHFSYISIAPPPSVQTAAPDQQKSNKNPVTIPTGKLSSEQVRRTYAIVVDDLGISFTSIPAIKQSLKKFINEDVQQGDLVAIVRTGGGSGALQSFTSDKRQLLAAVEQIRFNFFGRGGTQAFEPIRTTLKEDLAGMVGASRNSTMPLGIEEDNAFEESTAEARRENFEVGTIGALGYIIKGMSELPGRKSLILFSEGFSSLDLSGIPSANNVFEKLRILAEYANRSSAVFYTIDPRGLTVPGMAIAEDDVRSVLPDSAVDYAAKLKSREDKFLDTQTTLRYLAYETGGVPFLNNNNLSKGLERAMEDQKGYYLIGYEPDDETFDPSKRKYNQVDLNLTKDGLKVRTRNGFYGVVDRDEPKPVLSAGRQIYEALNSPFDTDGIDLTVNTLFAAGEGNEKYIQSLVHINGADLKFEKQADGTLKANFDVVAMTYGVANSTPNEATRNFTVTSSEENYEKVLEHGLVYSLNVPVKKSGAYQFRIAVRDSVSGKVGSASQFLTVPKLENKKMAMSGIVLNRYSSSTWQKILQKVPGAEASYDNGVDNALRRFSKGEVVQYGYVLYNVKAGTDLTVQTRLVKDGRVVLQGEPSKLDTKDMGIGNRLESLGAITLGKSLETGHYILQVIITDTKKNSHTTQWVEIEVREPAAADS